MPFIPHTEEDVKSMLATIGVNSIDDLFDEIPAELRSEGLTKVPKGVSEMEISRIMHARAEQDSRALCFAGAGAYEHHIPAAVWEITTRGEFYSAYTPYQAEASQGTLQLLYEYQTMMASLTGMDVSNASLYDGASALAEAVLMAVRANRKSKSKRILMPRTVHPNYRKVAHNIVKGQGITLEELDFDMQGGHINPDSLPKDPGDFTALVIPQPNYFGVLEDIDALTNWAHEHNALVIAVVNPTSLALLKAPGSWGNEGADITCGEGQPLGAPLSSGGPYFGFMACREQFVRQMPGRIIGRTVDLDGKEGFALTLQAREQHIRRSKATSNICTNQGLLVTAATIYMALVGPDGLAKVAQSSHANTQNLISKLEATGNASRLFNRPVFHESLMKFEIQTDELMNAMSAQRILPGVIISDDYPELGNVMLVCATETKSEEDLQTYADLLAEMTKNSESSKSPSKSSMA
ncbi:MAG: aminomethyl-transferring glycine dehydrogenase subunit GcvPA [Gammaproteobacteria bacterium]|nr:aminomethyl-transferring glycine dehydrogenase subunit GcvPA [Gammaproteobacteria bacterium]MCW8988382.1 aminomethyl-transferring glycine dehydrogenase subunit GcvPA [Gammaproteobacteria bacterium]MCW9031416.1 aminomethyl-transferring glycine dehydrogenase subunit GcvPA [Gammaproteobacteria bacterium]